MATRLQAVTRMLLIVVSMTSLAACGSGQLDLADFCDGSDQLDDTACLGTWIDAGRAAPHRRLSVPPGTYLYTTPFALYSGFDLRCADTSRVTFKNDSGTGLLFVATAPVHGVRIENCSVDVNGSHENFLAVISVNPGGAEPSTDIRVRRNHIYDSAIPGTMSAEQRQYILLLNCTECRVERNHLSEGGRIKLGRPGHHLVIRKNTVEYANDNAITVVDVGAGTSQGIEIKDNIVLNPKGVGIFFGADGEGQTNPALTTRDVSVEHNKIEGDWITACILGTLPAVTSTVRIRKNACVKTGTQGQYRAGIVIKRTNDAAQRATDIRVEHNRVASTIPWTPGSTPPLELGGIFFSGNHTQVRVTNNAVENVAPRAIYFHSVDITAAKIVHNKMTGGGLVIEGVVQGEVGPNTSM
jgi:hypothetical protein